MKGGWVAKKSTAGIGGAAKPLPSGNGGESRNPGKPLKKWQDVLYTGICLTKKVPQEEEEIMPKNMHYPHKTSN
ncbi:MAG: hypothetical protein J6X67_05645 [Treponema sp.]|nr:hypothetical protein [Treponema sp.]